MKINSEEDFSNFDNMETDSDKESIRRKYSVTGDILSYRRCRRQYGHFSEYDFSPARAAQLWFGQVIHETLDRAHRQYKGQIPEKNGGDIPSDSDIEEYFEQVHQSLKSQGYEPMSERSKEKALAYVKKFNREKGPDLYPKVQDTEHRLQKEDNEDEFIMEGIVDVLVRDEGDEDDPSTWEIWDYKASKPPEEDSNDYKDYRYQMLVYAALFKKKNESYPAKAVLYFLGAEEDESSKIIFTFNDEDEEIKNAEEEFAQTVENIRGSRENDNWSIDEENMPSQETCDACDIRFDCPAREGEYSRDVT